MGDFMPTGHYDRSKVNFGTAVCPCGKKFKKKINGQKFCSYSCPMQKNPRARKGMKICLRCKQYYPKEQSGSIRDYCNACREARLKEFQEQQASRNARPRHLTGRACPICQVEFTANRGHQTYCSDRCKGEAKRLRNENGAQSMLRTVACETCGKKFKQTRVYHRFCSTTCRSQHPEALRKVRDKNFWYEYGIDIDTFEAWFKLQGGKCEVCHRKIRRSRRDKTQAGMIFAIDHDHDTGEVRGLICQPCNLALGAVRDDEQTLLRLAKYLRNAQTSSRKRMIHELKEGNPAYLKTGKFPHLW